MSMQDLTTMNILEVWEYTEDFMQHTQGVKWHAKIRSLYYNTVLYNTCVLLLTWIENH